MSLSIGEKKGIKTWYYDFRVDNNRHRGWLLPVEHMTKRKAQAEVKRIKAEILVTGSPLVKPKKATAGLVKQVFDAYEDYLKTHRPKSYHGRMEYLFSSHFTFFHSLNQITPADITAYQKKRLEAKASPATVNRELHYCSAAFSRAMERGLVASNPFKGFDRFDEHERTRFLTKEELGKLLDAAEKTDKRACPLKDIIITAILTGMRLREILGLHRDEINLDLGTITKQPGMTKNKRLKVIPVSDALLPMLKARVEASPSGLLFGNASTGKPYDHVKRAWWRALDQAGITDFRFHDLRHTFATYALLKSKDLRGVQELLGHERVSTTQKYAHVLVSQKADIVNGLGHFISGLVDRKTDK